MTSHQKLRHMHRPDPLIIPAGEVVGGQDVFGVVVPDVQQPLIFALLRLRVTDGLRHLDVDLFVLPRGNCHLAVRPFLCPYGRLWRSCGQFYANFPGWCLLFRFDCCGMKLRGKREEVSAWQMLHKHQQHNHF